MMNKGSPVPGREYESNLFMGQVVLLHGDCRRVLKSFLFFCVFLSLLLSAGALPAEEHSAFINLSPEEKAWLKAHPVIRVAGDPSFPPVEYYDANGAFIGISPDYLSLLEQKLGISFQIIRFDYWDEVLAASEEREIDMISAAVKTPHRSEYLLFTPPHIQLPGVIVGKKEDRDIRSLKALAGRRLAVVSGYFWQERIERDYPGILLHQVPDAVTGLKMVSSGGADAMVSNLATVSHYLQKEGIKNLHVTGQVDYSADLSIACRRDWPLLHTILSKALSHITEEERTAVYRKWIYLKAGEGDVAGDLVFSLLTGILVFAVLVLLWFAVRRSQWSGKPGAFLKSKKSVCIGLVFFLLAAGAFLILQLKPPPKNFLTDQERRWLQEHPVIRLAPDPDFPPAEFIDGKGVYRGIAADYIAALEELLGIRFTILQLKDWDEVIARAKKKEADMFGAATRTPQRAEYMLFTEPYIRMPAVILVRKDLRGEFTLEKLKSMKVAVVSGYAAHDYMTLRYPEVDLEPVPNMQTGLRKVSFNMVDAMVANVGTATYYIGREGITNLRVAGETGYFYDLAFAVRNDWPMLRDIIGKGVARIPHAKKQAIYNKWVYIEYLPFYKSRTFYFFIVGAVATAAFFIVAVGAWNVSLRKTVARRTEALSSELSEREKAEAELRYLRNYLKSVVNSMPSVLAGVDQHGRVRHWNRRAAEVTGFTPEDAEGQYIRDLFPQLTGVMERILRALKGGDSLNESKVALNMDGEMRFVDITVYPLASEGVGGAVIRIDDVTERVRMDEMVSESKKMRSVGGLAAGMAHEINNPLAGIMQNVQVIKKRISSGLPINSRVAEACGTDIRKIETYMERRGVPGMIQSVTDSVRRAAEIVDNVLSLSRRSDESDFTARDMASILDSAVELIRQEASFEARYGFRRIEIIRRYEAQMPGVLCDAAMMQKVFVNVLKNGAEAMGRNCYAEGEGPRFVLTVRRDDAMAHIEIEDNGTGMEEEVRRRVFEPFFTTRSRERRTGLGLSVSYFIVTENHGGTMSVESAPGKGSAFVIRLPLALDRHEHDLTV